MTPTGLLVLTELSSASEEAPAAELTSQPGQRAGSCSLGEKNIQAGPSALPLAICLLLLKRAYKDTKGLHTRLFLTWGLTQSCGHPKKWRSEVGAQGDVGGILG